MLAATNGPKFLARWGLAEARPHRLIRERLPPCFGLPTLLHRRPEEAAGHGRNSRRRHRPAGRGE